VPLIYSLFLVIFSFAGFMLLNKALVVSGAFVGCSGIILTLVMCHNMNRHMMNVLLGGFGGGSGKNIAKSEKGGGPVGVVKQVTAEEVAELLVNAKTIIIAPGYGMAVAKAQHSIAQLAAKLRARGISVVFAIHPVAGRLPGHMNVLLGKPDPALFTNPFIQI
jgi:NAD/NADP transhydrogenase beta subunit